MEEAEVTDADLQRVLIRGYLDQMGTRDYPYDDVFRVRFGAVAHETMVVPFDGYVRVFLEPQGDHDEAREWVPRFWHGEITEEGFTTDTDLPYWEFTADGRELLPGEPVHLSIEARLPDGRVITGERESYA